MDANHFTADAVFKSANIITVNPSAPRSEALAIKDGKFIGVGTNGDIEGLIKPSTKIHDMRGKTIIPGLIDSHIHVLSSGIRHVMAADCGLGSIEEIQAALMQRVDNAARGEWVQGFKFDDTKSFSYQISLTESCK